MVLEKLMIITGYDKFYRTIQECSTFLEIEPVIFQWETASPELVIRLRENFSDSGKPEVIISRGAVADIIETNFPDIVVLRAEPDDLDLLESLEAAMIYGKRIGLLIYMDYGRNYKIDVLKRILDLKELRFYSFRSAEDIQKRIAEGKSDGMDAMVGGGTLGVRTGKSVGIPVCFASTSARSLERAILQALTIIRSQPGTPSVRNLLECHVLNQRRHPGTGKPDGNPCQSGNAAHSCHKRGFHFESSHIPAVSFLF